MARISKDELVELQGTLKTDAKIGAKFGISRQAVHQLRQKYGLEYNKDKFQERDQEVMAMYSSGKSGIKISKEIRISISQVYRILKKFNAVGNKGKTSE